MLHLPCRSVPGVCVLAIMVALLPVVGGPVGPAAAQSQDRGPDLSDVVAYGVRVTGDVSVIAGGYPMPFGGGVPLQGGDRVVTAPAAGAVMRLDGGMELVLGPDSVMRLGARSQGPAGWVGAATLERGALRLFLPRGPEWERFTVETPTATATTEDGDVLVAVNGTMSTVFVQDGRAVVGGLGRADEAVAVLPAGGGVDVLNGQVPYDPQPWPPGRALEIRALIEPR